MSLDLFFIAYEQVPPSAAMAEQIRMVEEEVVSPAFDAERKAVINDLKVAFPEYVFSPSKSGHQFGGLLSCDSCDLPDINFWSSHAMVEMGFSVEPEWSRQTLVKIAKAFELRRFAIYDPEQAKMWTAAELSAWLPQAIGEEQRVTKEIQDGHVELKERTKKPWWRLW